LYGSGLTTQVDLPHDAMLAWYKPSCACVCVCVCVCLSVTLWYCIKMPKPKITQIIPYDRTLVFCTKDLGETAMGSPLTRAQMRVG